jgi:hypothetical protein
MAEKPILDALADISLACHDPATQPPDALLEACRAGGAASAETLKAFRVHALSLFMDAAELMKLEGVEQDIAHRLLANEMIYSAAFVVAAMKRRLGEEPSAARFAIAAYYLADHLPVSTWDAAVEGGEKRPEVVDTADAVVQDIYVERRRQVTEEGWTPEHDDQHRNGELSRAAACYAAHASAQQRVPVSDEVYRTAEPARGDVGWPWPLKWWKPRSPRRDLERAGGLIVAEIERLDRLTPKAQNKDA